MKRFESSALDKVAEDILAELDKLTTLEQQIHWTIEKVEDTEYLSVFYESLALKFHNFYNGCERIFIRVAKEIDNDLPKSASWHKDLLALMSSGQKKRPAVITAETRELINDFLFFRHVVRSIYSFELDEEKLLDLVESYPRACQCFRQDILVFVDWLKQLSEQLSKEV